MSDWSMHRHIATVGVLGNAIRDRAYCAFCRKPWPCPVAQQKVAYGGAAQRQLAQIDDRQERSAFVTKMNAELLRLDASRAAAPVEPPTPAEGGTE